MSGIGALRDLESRYAMPTYARNPVEFVRGEGSRMWDSDGKEYIDLFSGLSVHNAGHRHPAIVAAIEQIGGDHRYRQELERGARRWYDQHMAPSVVASRLIDAAAWRP